MIITNVSSTSALPGTRITISGTGFGDDPSVSFGNHDAEVVQWSDTGLVCYVPNLPPGPYQLTVTAGNQNDSVPFTVLGDEELTITEVVPQNGPVGTDVTIIGSGFSASSSFDSLQVFVGDIEADSLSVLSDSELQFAIPEDATTSDISIVTSTSEVTSDIEFEVDSDTTARAGARVARR
jgi:IPT/TIG domain